MEHVHLNLTTDRKMYKMIPTIFSFVDVTIAFQ